MASDPTFHSYLNTFEFQWVNGRAFLTIAGASSLTPFPDLPLHAPGYANLVLYIRETCYLVDGPPTAAGWRFPLSRPTTIRHLETITSLAYSLEHNATWRHIQTTIDAIPSLPTFPATDMKRLIIMKIRDFVNGGPAVSALFAIQVITNIRTEDYLGIVANWLPINSSIGASDEAIARYLMVYELAAINDDATCTICMDNLRNREMAGQMPCMHVFHRNCITRWLRVRSNCPLCRCELPRY